MKNMFFLLSAIVASCVLSICNQVNADDMNPNMPNNGKRSCYPASKCTGDPNLIGGNGGAGYDYNRSNGHSGTKTLQTESTEKFEGTVKSVNRVNLPNQTQIQLVVTTDRGDMLVIVGPANFVDQAKVKMQAGDKITIRGYRIQANGNEVIVAAEIDKNGYKLPLLNENRQPVWGSQGYSGSQNPNMPNSRY